MVSPIAALCGLALVAGLGGGYLLGSRRSVTASSTKGPLKLSTVKVVTKDLVTYTETTATLGFTTSLNVSSPIAGTVTSLVASGDTIKAGSVVANIDGAPVAAMYGDTPGFRSLSVASVAGNDVRQLEMNLVQLGFDPNHKITIDTRYDGATAAAVTLFENSIGLKGDGSIPPGEIVFVPGQLLVDTLSTSVGGSLTAGATLLVARQTNRSFLIAGHKGARVNHLASAGTPVVTGTVLYWTEGFPVMAIEGDAATLPTLTRKLSVGGAIGADVKVLKQALTTLGIGDPAASNAPLELNQKYDGATAGAVSTWLQSVDPQRSTAEATQTVPIGGFVVVPSGLFVGTSLLPADSTLAGDTVVTTLTAPARQITTTAPVGSATFTLGSPIAVLFPDQSTQVGTVVNVGNVATTSSNQPGSIPNVRITIRVPEIPKSVEAFVETPVTLRIQSAKTANAFVVPVSALIALKEGGFAVETVTGADSAGARQTKLIGVKLGLFSDGFVQVDGNLSAGIEVVVPS
jgi:peptidoglycan hydrolase-like protein with peptidoglycan-binding domain